MKVIGQLFAIVTVEDDAEQIIRLPDGRPIVAPTTDQLRSYFDYANRLCARTGKRWRVGAFLRGGDAPRVNVRIGQQ